MTGWNLPPGCSVRDLPGAEPSAYEALAEHISEVLEKLPAYEALDEELRMQIEETVFKLCGASYSEGYQMGKIDEAMTQEALRP